MSGQRAARERVSRASYRHAIDWIAQNDSAGDADALDPEQVGLLITSVLVADLFDVSTVRVGQDVVRRRHQLRREETSRRNMKRAEELVQKYRQPCPGCGKAMWPAIGVTCDACRTAT